MLRPALKPESFRMESQNTMIDYSVTNPHAD